MLSWRHFINVLLPQTYLIDYGEVDVNPPEFSRFCPSVGVSICPVRLSVCWCIYLSVCSSVSVSICPSVRLSVYLSVRLFVCQCIYLSVCWCIYLSVCPSVYLSVRLHATSLHNQRSEIESCILAKLSPPLEMQVLFTFPCSLRLLISFPHALTQISVLYANWVPFPPPTPSNPPPSPVERAKYQAIFFSAKGCDVRKLGFLSSPAGFSHLFFCGCINRRKSAEGIGRASLYSVDWRGST